MLVDQLEEAGVGLGPRRRRHRQVLEGDPVAGDQVAQVGMVRHHHGDVDGQLPRPPAVEEVDQAVVVLRHHDQHPLALVLPAHPHGGAQGRRPRLEGVLDAARVLDRRLEPGPHAEHPRRLVAELGVLQDVGVELDQPLGDAGHDPRPVGAHEGEDVDGHRAQLCRVRRPCVVCRCCALCTRATTFGEYEVGRSGVRTSCNRTNGGLAMGIGISVFLIAVGAILTFAVNATVSGLDLSTIGVILMIAGAIGLATTLFMFGGGGGGRRTVVTDTYVDDDVVVDPGVTPPAHHRLLTNRHRTHA